MGSVRAEADGRRHLGAAPSTPAHAGYVHSAHGVEYFRGFHDVHAGCLSSHFVKRKRVVELITAFRRLRRGDPRTRPHVILVSVIY